jgi:hypothetical protein
MHCSRVFTCCWMMIISEGLPMKADTPPETAAHENRCADDRGWSELPLRKRSMALLVPNWLAVMGAMLPALICGGQWHASFDYLYPRVLIPSPLCDEACCSGGVKPSAGRLHLVPAAWHGSQPME